MKVLRIFSISLMAAVSLTTLVSWNSAPQCEHHYTVTGHLDSIFQHYFPADSVIYIVDMVSGDTLNKTKIQPDNTFRFEGSFSGEPCYVYTFEALQITFALEEGDIRLTTRPIERFGTPLNDAATRIRHEIDSIDNAQIAPLFPDMSDKTLEMSARMKIYEAYKAKADSLNAILLPKYLGKEYLNGPTNAMLMEYFLFMARSPQSFRTYWQFAGNPVNTLKEYLTQKKNYETAEKVGEGKMFVDITVPNGNPNGGDAKLSEYVGKGKYILVDFWASWCGPCRREIPNIKEIYAKYKGDKFDCLSIACWDKPEATKKAIAEEQLEWPQIINAQSIATDAYGINGIPQIILFGPDGKIVRRNLRGKDLQHSVAKALSQKK